MENAVQKSEFLSSDELILTVTLNYCLDESIVDRIEICTTKFIGDDYNTTDVKLDNMSNVLVQQIRLDRDKNLPQVTITIGNVNIRIWYRTGDNVARYASYDSEYMTVAMAQVGAAMRSNYCWVPMNIQLYRVLNNVGGHGINKYINNYVTALKDGYQVECVHQTPRSPFTNVLDIGVWETL